MVVLGVLGVELSPPPLDPAPMLPVLDPFEPLVEPLLSGLLPGVMPELLSAPLVLEPCSCMQRSSSVPVRPVQAAGVEDEAPDAPVPDSLVEDEPLVPPVALVEGEVVLLAPADGDVVLLEPTDGVAVLPLVLPLLWAYAPDMANNAAAVAETMSLSFICIPLVVGTARSLHARPVPAKGVLKPAARKNHAGNARRRIRR